MQNFSQEHDVALSKPTNAQQAWQDFEIGVLFSYELFVFEPGGFRLSLGGDWLSQASLRKKFDPNLYNPTKLDTDQWLEAAKAMGAKYALFTASHQSGFMQWQSNAYPYSLKQTLWRNGKADVFKDFVESCHKYGIRPGVFTSFRYNAYWNVLNSKVNWGDGGDKEKQTHYIRLFEQMFTELCSNYGELAEIWFDGGVVTPEQDGPDVLSIVEKYQPNTVFYHSEKRGDHRWIGSEDGMAGYPCWATMPDTGGSRAHSNGSYRELLPHGDLDGKCWSPGMCDTPIRDQEWYWTPNDEHKLMPVKNLINMYYNSVGRNCNLVIGCAPDPDGLIPGPDFKRCTEFGKEIRQRFSKPVAETTGEGDIVELTLNHPQKINHITIMEDIVFGERVRAYEIEGLVQGNTWQKICDGISIGHKRIQQFESVEVAKVRFRCTKSVAMPKIRKMAVYNVE